MPATRFAPSPTGRLHLGHAFSALSAFDWAQTNNARFLLRIEDIDTTRCRPEFEAGILEDLAWLGLAWESPVRRQSEHFAAYAAALEQLRGKGVLYRCFRTRREIAEASLSAPHAPDAPFRGEPLSPDEEQARLARNEPFAWRLSLARAHDLVDVATLRFHDAEREVQAEPDLLGDVILARKDTPASYHLAVVHDDALQGITHVIRGVDLFASTHIHVLLQRLLGLPTPAYHHHRLLTDEHGKRYAKRDLSLTLAALREAGESPTSIRRRVGLAP